MENEVGKFMAQVQQHLVEAGKSGSLSIDEQDIVKDFAEQDFGSRQCAERIGAERGTC
jgi:hypothetical protein